MRSSRVVAAADTVGVLLLAEAGTMTGFMFFNTSAAKSFVKLYDKATAPATNGSDTPFLTVGIAAGGQAFVNDIRKRIDLGLGYRITTAIADNDTTAPSAGDVTGMITYDRT